MNHELRQPIELSGPLAKPKRNEKNGIVKITICVDKVQARRHELSMHNARITRLKKSLIGDTAPRYSEDPSILHSAADVKAVHNCIFGLGFQDSFSCETKSANLTD